MIDYGKLQKSLKHLELQCNNYVTLVLDLPAPMREGIADSFIQRFETCYGSLWKALKRYLREDLGLAVTPQQRELLENPLREYIPGACVGIRLTGARRSQARVRPGSGGVFRPGADGCGIAVARGPGGEQSAFSGGCAHLREIPESFQKNITDAYVALVENP